MCRFDAIPARPLGDVYSSCSGSLFSFVFFQMLKTTTKWCASRTRRALSQTPILITRISPAGTRTTSKYFEFRWGLTWVEGRNLDGWGGCDNYYFFRRQDYSWEDHGFSLANRLYSDIGHLLDERFRSVTAVTSPHGPELKRAIWNYIHCMLGIRSAFVLVHKRSLVVAVETVSGFKDDLWLAAGTTITTTGKWTGSWSEIWRCTSRLLRVSLTPAEVRRVHWAGLLLKRRRGWVASEKWTFSVAFFPLESTKFFPNREAPTSLCNLHNFKYFSTFPLFPLFSQLYIFQTSVVTFYWFKTFSTPLPPPATKNKTINKNPSWRNLS